MPTSNIAQVFEPVKQKSDKIFLSHRIEYAVAAEILEGTNKRAEEILRICDFIDIVPLPGMHFATLKRMAGFYRLQEESYIKSVLNSCGIIEKNFPDDVKRGSWLLETIREEAANHKGRYTVSIGSDSCFIYDKVSPHSKRRVPISPRQTVYSPRVVLALAAIMYYGRHIPNESTASRVYSVLTKSDYYVSAIERVKRLERGDEVAPKKAEEVCEVNSEKNGIPVNPDGSMVFTPEVFAYTMGLVMKDMTEGMMASLREMNVATVESIGKMTAEIIAEIRKSPAFNSVPVQIEPPAELQKDDADGTAKRTYFKKLERPENWDRVLSRWRKRAISGKEAAALLGMSYSSFRSYASGEKKF